MGKMKLNMWIDLLLLLCFSLVVGIGFLIKYVLITGQEVWTKYGTYLHLEFLGMDRHEWGDVHLIFGLIMIFLLVLHVIYHWTLIKSMFDKFWGLLGIKLISIIIFLSTCLFFIFAPFFVGADVSNLSNGKEHYKTEKVRKYKGRNHK
ncbi:DUF4405 domain-containing protein [Marinifilum sp.]|uniref:DUF4405 domain-containing protein n=1 Tax=Marinifilum sp. TaxID=2033137 RepID=UPI003BAAEF21